MTMTMTNPVLETTLAEFERALADLDRPHVAVLTKRRYSKAAALAVRDGDYRVACTVYRLLLSDAFGLPRDEREQLEQRLMAATRRAFGW